jgi:hypothetical protein
LVRGTQVLTFLAAPARAAGHGALAGAGAHRELTQARGSCYCSGSSRGISEQRCCCYRCKGEQRGVGHQLLLLCVDRGADRPREILGGVLGDQEARGRSHAKPIAPCCALLAAGTGSDGLLRLLRLLRLYITSINLIR